MIPGIRDMPICPAQGSQVASNALVLSNMLLTILSWDMIQEISGYYGNFWCLLCFSDRDFRSKQHESYQLTGVFRNFGNVRIQQSNLWVFKYRKACDFMDEIKNFIPKTSNSWTIPPNMQHGTLGLAIPKE